MKYVSTAEIGKKWNISTGRIEHFVLRGVSQMFNEPEICG